MEIIMKYTYTPKGVCSMKIEYEITDGKVENVKFLGGCSGNTQGVAKLCNGRKKEEIIELLSGIKCGFKNTSCPDQLAQALKNSEE